MNIPKCKHGVDVDIVCTPCDIEAWPDSWGKPASPEQLEDIKRLEARLEQLGAELRLI